MIAISTICMSPHLSPFWESFSRQMGSSETCYFYHTRLLSRPRQAFGWTDCKQFQAEQVGPNNRYKLEQAEVLIECMRDIALIERRLKAGKLTVHMSERWLKPPLGILRVFHPCYFIMVRRFLKCLDNPKFKYFAQGVHAAKDMVRLKRLFSGDLRCLFRAPRIKCDCVPCGKIRGCDNIRIFGYFVEPSTTSQKRKLHIPLRILWVGRMLDWKRADTIVLAARRLGNVELTMVGEGPEELKLKDMADGMPNITFHKFVPSDRVRELMRSHDVYILSSDGGEGWGAALSEAVEEGMCVFGTYEAGASATILPEDHLYHAGDVGGLCKLLNGKLAPLDADRWSARSAADNFINFLKENGL